MIRPIFTAILVCCGTLALSAGPLVVSNKTPPAAKEDKFAVVSSLLAKQSDSADFSGAVLPWAKVRKQFTISRKDAVHAFAEGRAFFKIVALPPETRGQKLEILSYYSRDLPTTLFVPALLFLDANRKPVGQDAAPDYTIVNGMGEHIRVAVEIPTGAVYAVIYTSPARVAEKMGFQTYGMTGVLPSPTFAGKDTGFGGFYEGILKLNLSTK